MDEQKPAWLKVNFDRWQSEDASDSENNEQGQQEKFEVKGPTPACICSSKEDKV